jgi:hypothetical protein
MNEQNKRDPGNEGSGAQFQAEKPGLGALS